MAHMHNIWFNKINNAYQLAKFPELGEDAANNESNLQKNWIVVGSFEADTLEAVVSGFTNISKAHQKIINSDTQFMKNINEGVEVMRMC